jgi:hypothetical protein
MRDDATVGVGGGTALHAAPDVSDAEGLKTVVRAVVEQLSAVQYGPLPHHLRDPSHPLIT